MYGDYCAYVGVGTCLVILASMFVGQAAYLGSEYWLMTWAYRPAAQQVRLCLPVPCAVDMFIFSQVMLRLELRLTQVNTADSVIQ